MGVCLWNLVWEPYIYSIIGSGGNVRGTCTHIQHKHKALQCYRRFRICCLHHRPSSPQYRTTPPLHQQHAYRCVCSSHSFRVSRGVCTVRTDCLWIRLASYESFTFVRRRCRPYWWCPLCLHCPSGHIIALSSQDKTIWSPVFRTACVTTLRLDQQQRQQSYVTALSHVVGFSARLFGTQISLAKLDELDIPI